MLSVWQCEVDVCYVIYVVRRHFEKVTLLFNHWTLTIRRGRKYHFTHGAISLSTPCLCCHCFFCISFNFKVIVKPFLSSNLPLQTFQFVTSCSHFISCINYICIQLYKCRYIADYNLLRLCNVSCMDDLSVDYFIYA